MDGEKQSESKISKTKDACICEATDRAIQYHGMTRKGPYVSCFAAQQRSTIIVEQLALLFETHLMYIEVSKNSTHKSRI